MRAGRLRHKITIQRPVQTGGTWGAARTWETFKKVWGGIEPVSAKEKERAEHFSSEVTGTITIRWIAGIDPSMRVTWEGRIFRIVGVVDQDYRHRELQLYVVEGSDDQS